MSINRLFEGEHKELNIFASQPKTKVLNLEYIKVDPIFMGSGDKSQAKCYDLMMKMQRCFENLSGLQQSCMGDEDDIQSRANDSAIYENEILAADIYAAITGRQIITKKL